MSYIALRTDGNGYAPIADASQAGLNMGLSDFMIEGWIKADADGPDDNQRIFSKAGSTYWMLRLDSSGRLNGIIYSSNASAVTGATDLRDERWHYICLVVDRSSATGMQLYLDGSTEGSASNPATVENLDNASPFYIGTFDTTTQMFYGLIDEVRIWNFGFGGLPADYAAYTTWRAAGRNRFLDISEYNGGSWNGYADADREEKVTDGGLELWTGDTPDAPWNETGESAGVRDITKEDTEIHGGSFAAKLEATNGGGTSFYINGNISLVANKYYEHILWYHYPTRTVGDVRGYVYNSTDGWFWTLPSTEVTTGSYTRKALVFKPTVVSSSVYFRMYSETTTGIVYFDDISVKRVGLVGHWKFGGDYTDETSNSNDLVSGGTGNTFPGYTLHKNKIIAPAWVK